MLLIGMRTVPLKKGKDSPCCEGSQRGMRASALWCHSRIQDSSNSHPTEEKFMNTGTHDGTIKWEFPQIGISSTTLLVFTVY